MPNLIAIKIAIATGGAFLAAQPVLAERCNPPHEWCGEGNRRHRCPPCEPWGIHTGPLRPGVDMADAEQYRRSLEQYLVALEADRRADPDGPLDGYREGIEQYQQRIDAYRSIVRVLRAQSR